MALSLLLNVDIGQLSGKDLLALGRQVTVRPRKQLCVLLQPPETLVRATTKQTAQRVAKHALTGGWLPIVTLPIKLNHLVIYLFSELLPVL